MSRFGPRGTDWEGKALDEQDERMRREGLQEALTVLRKHRDLHRTIALGLEGHPELSVVHSAAAAAIQQAMDEIENGPGEAPQAQTEGG